MKKPKKFDCVEMKAKIQRQLLDQRARLGDEEARRVQWETVSADPGAVACQGAPHPACGEKIGFPPPRQCT